MGDFQFYFYQYGIYVLYFIVLYLLIRLLAKSSQKDYHSRWNTLIDNFNFSTEDFYALLKDELLNNGVDNINIKKVELKEGGAFSNKRKYLRVTWKDYQYDICAAPFGNGFFISWWLLYNNSFFKILISKIPLIGTWLANKLFRITYYKIDSASMLMRYAQDSVVNVINNITETKGGHYLSESARKPEMNDIFKR